MIEKIKAPINILPIDLVEQVTPALALAKLIEKVNYIIDIINEMGGYQPKHDDGLETEDKTVVGAINELLNKLNTALEELDTEIENILNTKQDKTDDALTTEDKTIVGAINELKGLIQGFADDIQNLIDTKQDKTDNELQTTVKTIVGAINEVNGKANRLNDTKQDKTDNTLQTIAKTIVGAINELNENKQNKEDNTLQTTEKTIVGAINELIRTAFELNRDKQNKTDNTLETTAKTIVGAINETRRTMITSFQEVYQNLYNETDNLNNNKQDKTDEELQTTAKTIVGAINEINDKTKILFSEVLNENVEYNLNDNQNFWNIKTYFKNNKTYKFNDVLCQILLSFETRNRNVLGLESLNMKSIPFELHFILNNGSVDNMMIPAVGQFNYIQGYNADIDTEYGNLQLNITIPQFLYSFNSEIKGFALYVDRKATTEDCEILGITPNSLFNGFSLSIEAYKIFSVD